MDDAAATSFSFEIWQNTTGEPGGFEVYVHDLSGKEIAMLSDYSAALVYHEEHNTVWNNIKFLQATSEEIVRL